MRDEQEKEIGRYPKQGNMQNNVDFKNTPMRATADQIRCARAGCNLRAIEGSEYCPTHQHFGKPLYDFNKVKIQNRLEAMRRHPDARNLEIELALIRHLLEKVVTNCTEDMDFLRSSGQIMQLVDRISSLLKTNIKVEQVTHQLLSIEEVVEIAQKIVAIVAEYLDLDDIESVTQRIEEVLVGVNDSPISDS